MSVNDTETDLEQLKQAWQAAEERYRWLAESNPDLVGIVADNKIVFVNSAGASLLGAASPDQMIGKSVLDFVLPRQKEIAAEGTRQIVQSDSATALTGQTWLRLDGAAIDVEMMATPITYQNAPAIQIVAYDIEHRKRVEYALEESERRYRLLLNSVTDYIYTVKLVAGQPVATFHGVGCESVTGYTPEEYQADPYLWYNMIYPDDRFGVSEQVDKVLAGKHMPPIEHRIVHKDGSVRWVRSVFVPRYDNLGELVAYDGLVADITQQKLAEQALARERDLLHALMDNIPDLIYFKDTNSRFTRINAAQVRMLGVAAPEQAVGKTDLDFFASEHASEAYADEQEIVRTGRPLIGKRERIRRADGEFRWVSCTKTAIFDSAGQVMGLVGISRDITSQMQTEEAMRKYAAELKARNEELDAFAHTVAHDLRHPLSVIIGIGETLESKEARLALSPDELDEILSKIALRARKMSNIVEELLLLASVRQEHVKSESLDMGRIVAEAQERLADMICEYQPQFVLPEKWPTALGYAPWIEEVWINYISNAIKYGGAPLRIELGATEVLVATENDRRMVRFWVCDNGPGMTRQDQARLFAPFTRLGQVRAGGHGLGLSIARRIVERLGGQVRVESAAGQGSIFSFTLPGDKPLNCEDASVHGHESG